MEGRGALRPRYVVVAAVVVVEEDRRRYPSQGLLRLKRQVVVRIERVGLE